MTEIIGMIHVPALPGTPLYAAGMASIITRAVEEARLYTECGVDMVAIENMHDVPYLKGAVGPEITAAMAVVGREVKQACGLPCGVQILAGANREALAVAVAGGLDFVRVEGFVFAHVADEGLIEASAGPLMRYRRQIGAEHVRVFADIKKKHSSHAITADVDIAETAHAAEFFRCDGVIVTGISTGRAADSDEVRQVKRAVNIPVWVGSGVTLDTLETWVGLADGLVVGSWFKHEGRWENPVDRTRVTRFMKRVRDLRK